MNGASMARYRRMHSVAFHAKKLLLLRSISLISKRICFLPFNSLRSEFINFAFCVRCVSGICERASALDVDGDGIRRTVNQ